MILISEIADGEKIALRTYNSFTGFNEPINYSNIKKINNCFGVKSRIPAGLFKNANFYYYL